MDEPPRVVVIAGPNGAGKSTIAPRLLQGPLAVHEFVNADAIAAGLSAFRPDLVAMEAGRIMLERIKALALAHTSFAFETTLASRSFAPLIKRAMVQGFSFHLVYLWLSSLEEAIARVAARVKAGGHDVPVETIRRRYHAGIRNFFTLYRPLASSWQILDNSHEKVPREIAWGSFDGEPFVCTPEWRRFVEAMNSNG